MFDLNNLIMINLFSRFNNGPLSYYDIIIMTILAIFAVLLDSDKYDQLLNIYNKIIIHFKYYTSVDIIGWEILGSLSETIDYPQSMIAINHYIYTNNKGFEYKYFNIDKNGLKFVDDLVKVSKNNECNYLLNNTSREIELYDDIHIIINKNNHRINEKYHNGSINTKIVMKLKSYKHNVKYIDDFINRCIIEYNDYIDKKTKNRIYHFIYQGKKNDKMIFTSNIISSNDKFISNRKNYETFDNIFHSNKNMIMKDIDRLHDFEYYKRTGMRRKKGYLFYGLPGTGKTSTVMAMSNYDNRHIIEVPYDRIKTNEEFESILSLKRINEIKFHPDNIIILFDELNMKNKNKSDSESESESDSDSESDSNKNSDSESESGKFKKNITKYKSTNISLTTILSRLDGIGNYNGLIIVATTNNIKYIDEAVYRDGRLSLVQFKLASYEDIVNIIEKYYEISINDDQLTKIKLLDNKISHARIRSKLEYYDDIDKLLDVLSGNIPLKKKNNSYDDFMIAVDDMNENRESRKYCNNN